MRYSPMQYFQVEQDSKKLWVIADNESIIQEAFPGARFMHLPDEKINLVYPEIEGAVDVEVVYVNCYYCEDCQASWQDTWYCACDDRCPTCNVSISPEDSHITLSFMVGR